MSVRLKRLFADYQRVTKVFQNHPYIAIKETSNNPPDKYKIEYKLKGLEFKEQQILVKDFHLVEIVLPLGYPKEAPICKMNSKIFHPNIAPHAICVGDHWVASESLVDLIIRIGEIISYQSYNIKSPLDGEAARWVAYNLEKLPVDNVDLNVLNRSEEISIDGEEYKSITTNLTESIAECLNCGKQITNEVHQRCSNGHQVCSDCLIECSICKIQFCVLCKIVRCRNCNEIVCKNCSINCSECGLHFCTTHSSKCNICNKYFCSEHALKCSICNQAVCQNDFNNEGKCCQSCFRKEKNKISISNDAIQDIKGTISDAFSCINCGYKNESYAKFCTMCGFRLKKY